MTAAVVAIFAFTYVLMASRRLHILPIGRPAGALLGAVLMVVVGAITPAESYAAIDHDTIVLLFGMMLLLVYLEDGGVLQWVSLRALGSGARPGRLLVRVALVSGLLSAFFVNDTICLLITPMVVAICARAGLPLGPYLIAIATSSNIGSAATLVGNPQNMIIGNLSGMPFTRFLLWAGPAAAVGLLLNIGLLWVFYGKRLRAATATRTQTDGEWGIAGRVGMFPALVAAGVIAGLLAGWHMGYTALGGALVLMLRQRHQDARAALARVDWPLLVFFCGLFIVVQALVQTGVVEETWRAVAPHFSPDEPAGVAAFVAFLAVGSNIVSNVPMTLLVGPYLGTLGWGEEGWVLLAFVATVAGNLTLLGSVANLIVAEQSRSVYDLGFREYLRFGLVSTAVVLAVGVPIVLWI